MDNSTLIAAFAMQAILTNLRLALQGLDALGLKMAAIHAEAALDALSEEAALQDATGLRLSASLDIFTEMDAMVNQMFPAEGQRS